MSAITLPDLPKVKPLGSRFRFFLLILIFLCLTAIWANVLTYNIAIVCMFSNSTHHADPKHRIFTNGQKTLAVVFVSIGTIVATGPVIYLVNRYGTRTILAVLGVLSSVCTFLLPLTIKHSIAAFYVLRFIQGIALACNMPVVGYFTERWTYYKQKGLTVSVLVTYLQLAPAFTNPVSGALCGAAGWESIFYFHGGLSLGLFTLYIIFFRNNPEKHPFVGRTESGKIARGKAPGPKPPVPYLAIVKTMSIWAVWVAGIGNFIVLEMLFLYTPTYLSKVLGFGVSSTGITSAIVPIAQGTVKVIAGTVSDKIHIPEGIKVRIFNTVGFTGAFIVLLVISFSGIRNGTVCLVLLGVTGAFIGLNTGGFFRASPVLSKQYTSFVTGMISVCFSIAMLILPFFVDGVTENNTRGEWEIVFVGTGAVMFISNIIFVIFVRGEPCWWTETSATDRVAPAFGDAEKTPENPTAMH